MIAQAALIPAGPHRRADLRPDRFTTSTRVHIFEFAIQLRFRGDWERGAGGVIRAIVGEPQREFSDVLR
jgi:hypothetical protein